MENLLKRLFMYRSVKFYALYMSISLFLISLWLPCYYELYDVINGADALCFGWLLCTGAVGTGWFANPLLFIAWVENRRFPILSLVFNSIAVIVIAIVPFQTSEKNTFTNELHNYGPGYWLWLASCMVMLVGNSADFIIKHRTENDTQP